MNALALTIINTVFSVTGSLANALVIFVIFTNEDLRIGANYFVASLAAADLAVCGISQTSYIHFLNIEWTRKRFEIFQPVAYIGLHASFANLLLLTANRFVAITRPFYHATLFRGKMIGGCVASVWISSAAVAIVFTYTALREISPYCHLFMLVLFVLMYVHIFFIVHKQRRQIHRQREAVSFNHKVARIRHDQMTTGTLAILCGTSVLLFLPDLFFQFFKLEDYLRFQWTFTTMFINSFLNPCIYVWRSKKFRKMLYKALRVSVANNKVHSHTNTSVPKCFARKIPSNVCQTAPKRVSFRMTVQDI